MPEAIVVIGCGGFGRETLDVIEAVNEALAAPKWHVTGVADDGPDDVQTDRLARRGYTFLGSTWEVLSTHDPAWYVVGIGNPGVKRRIAGAFDTAGWRAATLVHPAANVGSEVRLAPGSVVCGGVQLSTNSRLDRHVHLNPGAIIGHDSVLEEFVSANPGAVISGEARVCAGALVGAGAVILQGLIVGRNSIVGAAACVTRDVPNDATVVGIPARSKSQ